jgi:hypothetical protein
MRHPIPKTSSFTIARQAKIATAALLLFGAIASCPGQETPLISGGVGFFTNTSGGNTNYLPIMEPLIAAPIGKNLLIESRAALDESFSPNTNGQTGYSHSHFVGLTYLQGDFTAVPHVNVVAGSFLLPFGTFNERLSPIWINNFQDGPLIQSIGLVSTGLGLGGQLRGSVLSRPGYSITYATWYSASSANEYFNAKRSAGGRASVYLPRKRLEFGASYDRSLQGVHENFSGVHLWWEPPTTALRLRSEWARGAHAHGYWVEADYRTQAFGGIDSWIGRFEPVFRMQQTFRIDQAASDSVPSVNTQRADFGFDYNLPHNTRIITSYSRQFSSAGNENIWETGIVYRLLFPTWKGK